MNSLKEKTYKLSYRIEYNTNPDYPLSKNFGTCLGILFNSEESANAFLDLEATRGTILECNLEDITETYKPRKSYIYATTRSWE